MCQNMTRESFNVLYNQVEPFPKPFRIPKFCAKTDANLQNEILTGTDRKYMYQMLAMILMTYVQRPSLKHCGGVAKALLDTHIKMIREMER